MIRFGIAHLRDRTRPITLTNEIAGDRPVSLLNELVAQGALPAL